MSNCNFEKTEYGWKCSVCGRMLRTKTYPAPVAICRTDQKHKYVAPLSSTPQPPSGGAGTELKKLLSKIGIVASPGCSCNARAARMDMNGIEWCEANLDEIVGWLREEAHKRNLPFIDAAGKILVKKAISNAKKIKKQDAEKPKDV